MAVYRDLNCFFPTIRPQLYDVEVIYQSLFNIFNTRPGEVLFQPDFGMPLEDELFELMDSATAFSLFSIVVNTVQRWEKRVSLDLALSKIIEYVDDNKYEMELSFTVNGMGNQLFEYRGSFLR
jgi:phage baseplate assembly protein W